jgi:hypothetical protein
MYQPFARFNQSGEEVLPPPPNITSFDIDHMLKHYEYEIHKQFLKHFNNDAVAFNQGKNLLSYKMALELTERFLKKEKEFLTEQTEPVFIESLERELRSELEIDIFGTKKKVVLRGFVDRIDSIGGQIRIIDYKSGRVSEEDTKVGSKTKDIDTLVRNCLDKKHLLQLIIYCYLFKKNFNILPKEASIISFININDGVFKLQTGSTFSLQEVVDLFPEILQKILEHIHDPTHDFEHNTTPFVSFCAYC